MAIFSNLEGTFRNDFSIGKDNKVYVGNDAGEFTVDLGGSEVFRIDLDGNMGINSDPSARLDIVVDDTDNVPGLEINQNDITNNPAGMVINNAGTGNYIVANNGSFDNYTFSSGGKLVITNEGNATVKLQSFGGGNKFNSTQANGTVALPTATQEGDILFQTACYGYGATGITGVDARYQIIANENFTDTEQGSRYVFSNTITGTTTLHKSLVIIDRYIGVNTGDIDPPISLLEVREDVGAGILTLSTAEATVVATDEIGKINFQAPLESAGTDAILPGAAIWGVAEDTFAADNNSMAIVFGTATSSNPIERVRIDSAGNMGVGAAPISKLYVYDGTGGGSSPNAALDLITVENDDTCNLNLISTTTGNAAVLFSDDVRAQGNIVYNFTDDYMKFCTNGAANERMRIESDGTLNVSGTTNYETLVTDDDDIPNKRYVDDASLGVVAENTDIDTGTETVDSFADTDGDACSWTYVAKKGANLRAGTVVAVWDATGDTIDHFETTTNDIGDTSPLTLDVDIDTNTIRLRATVTSDDWSVKVIRVIL